MSSSLRLQRADSFCIPPCIYSISHPGVFSFPEGWVSAERLEPLPLPSPPPPPPAPGRGDGRARQTSAPGKRAAPPAPAGTCSSEGGRLRQAWASGAAAENYITQCALRARWRRARVRVAGQSAGRGAGGAGGGGSGGSGAWGSLAGSREKAPAPPWPRRSRTPGGWSASRRTSTTPTGRPATSWRSTWATRRRWGWDAAASPPTRSALRWGSAGPARERGWRCRALVSLRLAGLAWRAPAAVSFRTRVTAAAVRGAGGRWQSRSGLSVFGLGLIALWRASAS